MKYQAIATDYDGTIAFEGKVDEPTADALRRARDAEVRLVMVTGRELPDLFKHFEHVNLFDRVVAENGAVLYDPGSGSVQVLADSPPPELVNRLIEVGVPISVGHCVVATVEPHEHAVLAAIRDLGIQWHVIFNKGYVMALPADVTKATGLSHALAELGIPSERVVGVGDAENDHAFMRLCGLAAAVDNALPAVKDIAHVVTRGSRGAGVTELIERLLGGDLDHLAATSVRTTNYEL